MKTNTEGVAGIKYYITFKGKDASHAIIETFQTIVWMGIGFLKITSI